MCELETDTSRRISVRVRPNQLRRTDGLRRTYCRTIAGGAVVWLVASTVAADPLPAGRQVHASWTALPLADVAAQATRFAGLPIIVDRRIDPTTRITLEADGETADAVATTMASRANADVARLATMLRIAPPLTAAACEEAERIRATERRRLPAAQREYLDAAEAWTWPAGSRPRDLLAAAAHNAGTEIEGLDAIPHDHLPAATLPPLPLADRLDLVLAHYDQRVQWTASAKGRPPRGRIVPLPTPAATTPRNRPAAPAAAKNSSPALRDAFTLRVEAPLDEVLAAVGKRLALTVDIDEQSLRNRGITPREIVRASVADASRDHLLDAITKPLGLSWKVDGDRLRVWAPPAQ